MKYEIGNRIKSVFHISYFTFHIYIYAKSNLFFYT
jgi:hypothetical protein